jgi:RNA polymerase sigma factor for flagellar operon FliA
VQELSEPELWSRYRVSGDAEARDRLFLHYAPWASSIARHVHARVRAYQIDRDDFVQNATIGLLEAMSRFDPARGIAFRSYAQPRVRGAVFNGLRAILGDRPAASEEAKFAERLQHLQDAGEGESAFDSVVNAILNLGLGCLLDEAALSDQDGCLHYAHTSQLETRLGVAIKGLPERLRMIVHAHYFLHVPFQEIAAQLRLTKGRISQLHKEALMRLRASLAAVEPG